MRRAFLAGVLLLLCFFVSGCVGTDLPLADYSVETVTVFTQEDGNDITLMYPEIVGYSDADAQARMNEAIAAYARAMYTKQDLVATADGGYEYAAIETVVTLQTEGFLSAYVGGVISSAVSGNTSCFSYTLNCDINNGCIYTSEDLLSDYASLVKRFKKGEFTQDFGYTNLSAQMSFADMILQYKEEYGIYPQIYFTDDDLGFLIEVVPVLDGYAGYTLPLRRARGALNDENPLVAFVTGRDK